MAVSDLSRYHERTRTKGVNKAIFWAARVVIGLGIQFYFSLERTGRGNIPKKGPVILAANHRSFLDPFLVGCLIRRPVYFVAKKELFDKRWQGWLLNRLGAFPIKRGESDEESMATARAVLESGAGLVVFP
jgi:1-acyl-sn-glycerol-3-phosphate acyltransferase